MFLVIIFVELTLSETFHKATVHDTDTGLDTQTNRTWNRLVYDTHLFMRVCACVCMHGCVFVCVYTDVSIWKALWDIHLQCEEHLRTILIGKGLAYTKHYFVAYIHLYKVISKYFVAV